MSQSGGFSPGTADRVRTADGRRASGPWLAEHLDELCRHAEHGLDALAGDTLARTDIRADNLLISDDGTITIVDWPHGCRGPAWLDTLLLLINIRLHGGART